MTEISQISQPPAPDIYSLPSGTTYDDAIAQLKIDWDNLNSPLQSTNTKLQAVSNAVDALQVLGAQTPPPSQATLNAALATLQTAQNNLGSFNLTTYINQLTALKDKAAQLLNAEAAKQQADDDASLATIQRIQTLKDSLNDSDPVTDQQLANAITQYEADRSALNLAINNYRNACYLVALDRLSLQQTSIQYYLNAAQSMLNNPTDTTKWTLTKPQNLINQITTTSDDIQTREARKSAVTSALNTLTADINSASGLVTCLTSLKATRQAAAQSLIDEINQAAAAVQTYIATQQAADAAELTQHYIDYPSTSSLTSDQLAAITARYGDLINASLTQMVSSILGAIDLPVLTGGELSMSDIMRIIGQNALILQQTLHYARISDADLNILRATILSLLLGQGAESYTVLTAYSVEARNADIAFNNEDIARYNSSEQEIANLENNMDAINQILVAYPNDQNQALIDIVNNLNAVGSQIAQTLNDASSAQPDAINYFDLLNLDPLATTPSPLPVPTVPTPIDLPLTSIQVGNIPTPPSPPTQPGSPLTQSQIDAIKTYNDAITKINETLALIQPALAAQHIIISSISSTNPYQLTPLVYHALISVRNADDIVKTATTTVQNLVSTVINMLSQASTGINAKILEDNAVAFFTRKMTGESAQPVPSTVGASGMATTDIDVAPSTLTRAMMQALQSTAFKVLVQQLLTSSALYIGAQLGIKPPESFADYSTFGLITETGVKPLTTDQIKQFITSLQQLASQLVALSQKSTILTQIAAALVAMQKEPLSAEDTKVLMTRIIQAVQVIVLTFATVALASSTAVGRTGAITIPEFNIAIDSKKATEVLARLFSPETAPVVTSTDDMKKAVSTFIAQLNINLDAIDEKTRNTIIKKILDNMTETIYQFLTEEEKMKLATAIATNQITQETIKEFAKVFIQIATGKVSSTSIQKLYQLLSSPDEKLFPVYTQIKDAIKTMVLDKKDADRIEQLVTNFAETIITQKDFYQFSIDFLLDPAKSFLKNFSLFTRESEKPGTQPMSRIMGA